MRTPPLIRTHRVVLPTICLIEIGENFLLPKLSSYTVHIYRGEHVVLINVGKIELPHQPQV